MWCSHNGFQDLIQHVWSVPTVGNPIQIIIAKRKAVKQALKQWNKNIFGNIFTQIQSTVLDLNRSEATALDAPSLAAKQDIQKLWDSFSCMESYEEIFWKQKSRAHWLEDGDRNTKFFHSIAAGNSKRSIIHSIKRADGTTLSNIPDIKAEAIAHFQLLLQEDDNPRFGDFLDPIPHKVIAQDNTFLMADPSYEELLEAVKAIPLDGATTPDEFTTAFFQSCWPIIRHDLLLVAKYFIGRAALPRALMASLIYLIPKISAPASFSDFHHISLCNYLSMAESCILVQETFRDINKKVRGGNLLIKLYMEKAYDRLNWKSLREVLKQFGFHNNWIFLVKRCWSECWFSVLINGEVADFFHSYRGLR
ncbi:uncharacterized protein LOC131244427 [Magnolia sinica]|uniref:uncharacterized protein LOC131244427 n=1 Tax=Magnolia sinica TaxID=86752 RepID=UPI002659DF7D|nr:uncharacterized protein LOC131244427 [Magnolia sinica]